MARRTIKLKKYIDIIEERDANADILPGMLVELMSTGKVRAHSSSGGEALTAVALEDELQGKTIDDKYVEDDKVQIWVPNRGEQALMILKAGQVVVVGDNLVSNGDGTLKKAGSADTEYIGKALQAVNLSASGAANGFIEVVIY